MPGLNQLKKFTNDIKKVGDEEKIRAQRGEKPAIVPLPEGISEEDDSKDFILGMPEDSNQKQEEVLEATSEQDFQSADSAQEENADAQESGGAPDLQALLNPVGLTDSSGIPDLSEFEDEKEPAKEEIPLEDMDLTSLLNPPQPEEPAKNEIKDDFPANEQSEEPAQENDEHDFGIGGLDLLNDEDDFAIGELDSSNGDDDFASTSAALQNATEDLANVDNLKNAQADSSKNVDEVSADKVGFSQNENETPQSENDFSLDSFDLPKLDDDFDIDGLGSPKTDDGFAATGLDSPKNEEDFASTPVDNAASKQTANTISVDKNASAKNDEDDDFAYSGEEINLNDDIPDEIAYEDGDMPKDSSSESKTSSENVDDTGGDSAQKKPNESQISVDSLSDENDFAQIDSSSPDQDLQNSTDDNLDFDLPDFDLESSSNLNTPSTPDSTTSTAPVANPLDASSDEPSATDFSSEVPPSEDFSSALDGMAGAGDIDFGGDSKSASSPLGADEFPVTVPKVPEDDFLFDENSFEIPGFSDTDTVAFDKKGRPAVDIADFSKSGGKPKNSLTDEEYKIFRKNFAEYPLNLRLAIEDLVVKNEFTDEAVFEVLEKVLKKVPARQLATHLEKMLDITIDVPRDYERRSFAQYEAYKQSFQYQLKNRIIPGGIFATVVALLCYLLFQAGVMFIYKPTMARILYSQGYTLLENNEYKQSESVFADAVKYKPIKKWFFKYAEGYRDHNQYERAAQMYKNILGIFNHDKKAGLDWAQMELYDRANYEKAEQIVRREILDFHINDSSALLLLGDVFLEWGEVEPSKYEDARSQYSDLIQLYGANDLYLSRMLRYFIRTDKLKNVLELKNRFYPREKSLEKDDWVELSGYALEKLYGPLPRSEEYLRSRIEDVRAMLEIALKKAPENPTAHYNMAKYFNENSNFDLAKRELTVSLDCFDALKKRTKKNVYQEIDACRLLGNLYVDTREYLKAQEIYARGISLFQNENERTGLEGDKNTGLLYASMGDIEYFVSGDMDAALNDYEQAIFNKNDTASINFRIGAIRYNNYEYDKALNSFLKANETEDSDVNLLLALANVLSLRGDNFAAEGYYSRLLSLLNTEKNRHLMLFPQDKEDDNRLVEMFLKVNNNLGVTLYKIAKQTGDSKKNAESLVRLSDSIRAWDALTRNPKTMVRLGGSNLALQNSKYITNSRSDYEPAIYTDIPKTLTAEKILD